MSDSIHQTVLNFAKLSADKVLTTNGYVELSITDNGIGVCVNGQETLTIKETNNLGDIIKVCNRLLGYRTKMSSGKYEN